MSKYKGRETGNLAFLKTASDLDENLIDTCPFSSMNIEEEERILDYLEELSSKSSDNLPSQDFESIFNRLLSSSSSITIPPEILIGNLVVSTEDNVSRAFAQPQKPTISKTIVVSHLPATVDGRQLRKSFPRCHKIVFKKNYWNKNFRL